MTIVDNIRKIKSGVFGARNLKKTLAYILAEIENIKGNVPLSDIFVMIGETLQKDKINSIVCIVNEKRNETVVRSINFSNEIKNVFTGEETRHIEFYKIGKYGEAIGKKETVFSQNRFAQLNKLYKNYTNTFDNQEETNSIIAPLVLRGEIIATLELFSPDLQKENLELLDDFVKRLVISITNNILFYEIKESEKRYRNLFKNASDGLAFFNLQEKRFKESNPAMREISGYTQDELRQLHYLLVFLSEDRKKIEEMINMIRDNKNKIVLPIKFCTKIKSKKNETKICDIEIGMQLGNQELYFNFKDVTKQKNSELALKDNEEKYRMLFDNAGDGVMVFDTGGRIVLVNKAMAEILEGEEDDIKKREVFEYVSTEDLALVSERFKDGVAGKNVITNYDFRINTLKGNKKYINYSGTLIIKNGQNVGVQAIIRDISENMKLQEQTRKTKRHYVSIIDSIKDDIVVISENFIIISANRSFANNVGLGYREVKGKSCAKIMRKYKNGVFDTHCFNRNCRVCTNQNCGNDCVFLRVFKKGNPEYFIEKSEVNNESKYFGIGIFPIKSNEKINQVIITIRDISESKLAEEENLRLTEFNKKILDASPVSIVVLNNDGEIVLGNGMAKKLLGSEKGEIVGMKLRETSAIKNNEGLQQQYRELLQDGRSFFYDNLSYSVSGASNGRKNYLNIIAVPLYNLDKKVDGAISMAIDNTEKVLAQQKLEKLNKELELKVERRTAQLDAINKELKKVLELKLKFISDASHELRTPLTVIQGNIDLTKQEYMYDRREIPEAFELIGKEVEQMTGILSDLTMLTNTDASNESINYDNVDINLLAAAVTQSLSVLAKQKKIVMSVVNEHENIEIIGDETKLEKLLLNIVRNAIKYTEEAGTIEIRTQKDNEFVRLIVKDTGIGIPAADLPYIFERFYRVDKARSRKEGGTGLGLSICKWIVEAHGGNITVASELNKGSVFTINLPLNAKGEK